MSRPHAIILAAGLGSRLRPLTDHTPKPLVEVAGHPLIAYGLGLLRENGIEDVVVNVHHLADRVRDELGDGSKYGVRIRYSVERVLLDSGGGIRQAATLFEQPVDGPLVVLNADVVTEVPLKDVLAFHARRDALATFVLRDDPRKDAYGVFGIDPDGRIQRFLGRGAPPGLPEYMFASVQILSPSVLARMPEGPFSSMRGLYPDLFAEQARLFGYVYNGPWHTADTREDLENTAAALQQNGLPGYMSAHGE
ncbi:MAG: nucleotidyltransferase family protein [Candidatus Binatia bacterium]|nr:nucleotidyltransferase family protein [Candidatus Binatia bacterium]